MKRWYLLALISLYFAALTVRLIPPLTNGVWGPDTGENYYISNYFALHLKLPDPYLGFGLTYTEFPIVYILAALTSVTTGLNTFLVSELIMPFFSSLLVFPVAGIAESICKRKDVALGASAFYAASALIAAHTSIIASDTLGEFLLILFIYFYLNYEHSHLFAFAAWVTAFAMIPSYHVGTIMLLLFLYSDLLYTSISRDKRRSIRGVLMISIVATATWIYWLTMARVFLSIFILRNPHLTLWEAIVAPYLVELIILYIGRRIRIGRIAESVRRWQYPEATQYVVAVATVIPLVILSFTGLKSLSFLSSPYLISFAPTAFFAVMGGITVLSFSERYRRAAPLAIMFFFTLLIIIVGLITQISYLVPLRVIEYTVLMLPVFAGFYISDKGEKRKIVAVSLVTLFLLASCISMLTMNQMLMPSKTGASPVQDIDASLWIRYNTQHNSTVASDHPLSSIVFGFGERNATWEKGGYPIFEATSESALLAHLMNASTPAGTRTVDFLLIDSYMYSEGNYYPNQSALPVSPAFSSALDSSYFLLLYSNGFTDVYVFLP
jgi:hypothetical protein